MSDAAVTPHTFYIPVMGTGFTIDTPLKVAQFGISSSISLVDDVLIEKMRKHHAQSAGLPYQKISERDYDTRASRIRAYLNLVNYLVDQQIEAIRNQPFRPDQDITRYFQLLPEGPLKSTYKSMLKTRNPLKRRQLEKTLRSTIRPGRIDVNIMTKVDAIRRRNLKTDLSQPSDALSALRGFALSDLQSAVIFSAGLNPRLYQYAAEFPDFFPDANGQMKKQIIIKVSDYRSALIQGKYLAKRGLWVSEFRIESGLNCGGHAFASDGHLMGPILQEFSDQRENLKRTMEKLWRSSLQKMKAIADVPLPDLHICAQGGVGTASEHQFLLDHFNIDEIGWGTPFMLAPDVTLVDDDHLKKLKQAKPKDVSLSEASPLGIPFWSLRDSASEAQRMALLQSETPGSKCPKEYAITNTEFTEHPICTASRQYQSIKVKELKDADIQPEKKQSMLDRVLAKACICHDLAGSATTKLKLVKKAFPAICCGPNIAFFNKTTNLKQMVDHIYGRISLLKQARRPNMFINELRINFDWIANELDGYKRQISDRPMAYFQTFKANLTKGIETYRQLAEDMIDEQREAFLNELKDLEQRLEVLFLSLQEATS